MCTLEDLNNSSVPKFCFVYTGLDEDSYNNGYDHHWLFLFGNKLFDSYGYQSKYTLPSNIKHVITNPRTLQQFNTNVCGEYCCAFYYFIKHNTHNLKEDSNLGYLFQEYFELSNNKDNNDKQINTWFDQITK